MSQAILEPFAQHAIVDMWLFGNLDRRPPALAIGYQNLRATSHTRLRTRDHYTSSTLIGGKGGAGPSSLHTTLEGPREYVNARCM